MYILFIEIMLRRSYSDIRAPACPLARLPENAKIKQNKKI
jgi:hypothetical protein